MQRQATKHLRTGDLFDVPDVWKADPVTAFEAFVTSMAFVELSQRRPKQSDPVARDKPKGAYPLRASSAKVYCHMWQRFMRWCKETDAPFWMLTKDGIEAFLEERGPDGNRLIQSATIRRQYVTMLERIYKHLQIVPNPALGANFDMADSTQLRGRNEDTVTLTAEQQQAFLDALPFVATNPDDPMAGWEVRRDRAVQAMMLGAGLKVSEVMGLYTANVQVDRRDKDGCVPVEVSPASAGGTVIWHTTLLRPPAAAIVLDWIAERKTLPVRGMLLFPTWRGTRLDKTWIYRKTRETYAAAGLEVPRRGGRTLRNTYAVSQLAAGTAPADVTAQLGHRTQRALETYTTALEKQRRKAQRRGASPDKEVPI
ncbi:tyrosine-type recombinase/integrase [Noviherbaspirillum galbum]|uniref:Tyrosine-type recombinase/integrase n=1 Tax=Noviherbaspirillum galbum TaxID=2709383 RepID=A0A6B3SYY0_9BURK|nr:site-specific integrase [Noviherbaspirillum galbum]NEX63429.1 tyrosine-type recombinase/integrase [Noviherbaspirillum galbum]